MISSYVTDLSADVKLRQDDVKLWNAAINPELHEIEVVQIYLAAFPKHRFQEGEVPFDRGFTLEILVSATFLVKRQLG